MYCYKLGCTVHLHTINTGNYKYFPVDVLPSGDSVQTQKLLLKYVITNETKNSPNFSHKRRMSCKFLHMKKKRNISR